MPILLGCIADDFTGATDVANEIQQQGLRTVLFLGNNYPPIDLAEVDAIVIALKIRTAPTEQAVEEALAAFAFLQKQNTQTIYFKYCSTFDSNEKGNIGPITDALMDAMGESFTLATPAFPRTARTVFNGYLFVGDVLLSESPMRHHPLTPMTDANLVRLLDAQTKGRVGLIPHSTIQKGSDAIQAACEEAKTQNHRYAIVDAIADNDLIETGKAAFNNLRLLTGASGLAHGLAQAMVRSAHIRVERNPLQLPKVNGGAAVLAGSCSQATLAQIDHMKKTCPSYALDVLALAEGADYINDVIDWAGVHATGGPILIYTSQPPEQLKKIQDQLGADKAGELAETAFAHIAQKLVGQGTRRLVVAGGETAGAVVRALDIDALRIGPEIDPGVPWTVPANKPPMLLALKSGNFGADNFFTKALEMVS